MKKLLSLLSVLTISGTAVPTTIAASPYQKEEKLNRSKRIAKNDEFYQIPQDQTIENLENYVTVRNFNLGINTSDREILDTFINRNNIINPLLSLLYISSRPANGTVRISVQNNNRFIGQVVVNYNIETSSSLINNRLSEFPQINMQNLNINLGVFRGDLRGGITNERIISRFLEINNLPQNLSVNFQVINNNNNNIEHRAVINIRSQFVWNAILYNVSTEIVNYTVHDETK